jgi:hypothetical protein
MRLNRDTTTDIEEDWMVHKGHIWNGGSGTRLALVVAGCSASPSSRAPTTTMPSPTRRVSAPCRRAVAGGTSAERAAVDVRDRHRQRSYNYARRQMLDGGRPTRRPYGRRSSSTRSGRTTRSHGDGLHRRGRTGPGCPADLPGDGATSAPAAGRPADPGRRRRAERPDAALTFVVDVSGSMGEPGGSTWSRTPSHDADRPAAPERLGGDRRVRRHGARVAGDDRRPAAVRACTARSTNCSRRQHEPRGRSW